MRRNRRETIGWLLAGLAGLAVLTACPTRDLPSQPESRSEKTIEGAQTVDRMPIVRIDAPRRGLPSQRATPTPPNLRTATRGPTTVPTRTPPRTTPTPPPTLAPTQTPTSTAPIVIRLRAVRWAWQWVAGPGTSLSNPSSSITLKSGQRYSLHVFDGDISDPNYEPHMFSGVLGLVSGVQLAYNAPDSVQVFTAPTVTSPAVYPFSCGNDLCVGATGDLTRHENMLGSIVITP